MPGQTWTLLHQIPGGATLLGVWGANENDVYAVGTNGMILNYDGVQWTVVPSGTTATLTAVSGSSPSDVFAVGLGGTILHFDGFTWAPQTSGTTADLLDVHCLGVSHVVAVGTTGAVRRNTGSGWSAESPGTTEHLNGVAGFTGGEFWAAGSNGSIVRHDTTSWLPSTSSSTSHLYDIGGPPTTVQFPTPTILYAVGPAGMVLEYGGSSWDTHACSAMTNQHLYGLWYSGPNFYVVGTGGTILEIDGPRCYAHVGTTTAITLHDIWGSSSTHIFAVGDSETVVHFP
jgi:hypothetical protein